VRLKFLVERGAKVRDSGAVERVREVRRGNDIVKFLREVESKQNASDNK
jgi:hypothetical protein